VYRTVCTVVLEAGAIPVYQIVEGKFPLC